MKYSACKRSHFNLLGKKTNEISGFVIKQSVIAESFRIRIRIRIYNNASLGISIQNCH